MQIQEQFIPIEEGQLYARTWTPPQIDRAKDPIILLHDSLGCVDMWRDFPARLATALRRPVVAYDRLGFGRSTARSDLPSFRFVQEEAEIYFPQVLRALAIESFSLFGHSVGGGMALVCASRFKKCTAVVSESAQSFVEERTIEGIKNAKVDFENPALIAKLKKVHGDKAAWVLRVWADIWSSPEFAAWNLREDLAKVRCPALVIHGDRDEYGSQKFPERIVEWSGGPTELHLLEGFGHVPHREDPDLIENLIVNFLRDR